MSSNTPLEVFKMIRSKKGCSLRGLIDVLPEAYANPDSDPVYFLHEPLKKLFSWGLIQAYRGSDLVKNPKVARIEELHDCNFYVSPIAAALEAELGFSLQGIATSMFGPPIPKKRGNWPQLLVLMPFAAELQPIYEDHIKASAASAGLSAARADDFFGSRSVVQEVWSAINHAQLIVADCTGRNPNVFYEIGIAHAIGKETILISQSVEDVPFDLRHLRVVIYEFTPRGMADFERRLKQTLASHTAQP